MDSGKHENKSKAFVHLDPGPLRDGDLSLHLREEYPGDPAKDYVPAYRFGMRLDDVGEDVGIIDLRIGMIDNLVLYGGHIGYGVKEAYRGRSLAARACRLVLPLAARHGLPEVWITCNPDNHASIRTIEKLVGATFEGLIDVPESHEMYARGERQKRRYRIPLTPAVDA